MARVTRSRSRLTTNPGGVTTVYDNGVATDFVESPRVFTNTCNDSHGSPIVDSPFSSTQYPVGYPRVSGDVDMVNTRYKNHYSGVTVQAPPIEWTTSSPSGAPSGWMLDLVAGTNPSRPVLNIPELIEDIWDLPKALKNLGDLILHPGNHAKPKGLAGEYLGVQFGWLPLIEDLQKLLEFQTYAIKRNKELHQLYSGKGLRRRLKFGDSTVTTQGSTALTPYPAGSVTVNLSVTVTKRQWATIHWYPTSLPPYHPDDEQWNTLSTKLVLGATPEAMVYGLWKVIPWTWLIGWFTNVGKFALANSYTVPAAHGSGCFMSYAEAKFVMSVPGTHNAAVKSFKLEASGEAIRRMRTRVVSSQVTAGVNIPYLDMFRLSILGALFTQRFAR